MTTYNFSVRATDNLGAFADRAFDITVNNTSIERFVAVGQNGLAHSQNGVAWTYEAGLSGIHCAYGNGQWAVVAGSGLDIRTSPDAVNWTTYPLVLPAATPVKSINNTTITANPTSGFNFIKYVNGAWRAFIIHLTSPQSGVYAYHVLEYKSVDLVNWTFQGSIYFETGTNGSGCTVSDLTHDPISQKQVLALAVASSGNPVLYLYTRDSSATTWDASNARTFSNPTVNAVNKIVCTNGLWCVTVGPDVYTSFNARDWVRRPLVTDGTGEVGGLTYANGRLVTRQYFGNANAAFWTSLDGGRTWTRQNLGSPGAIANGNTQTNRRNPLVSYGGIILSADINYQSGTFSQSTNDGTDLLGMPSNASFNKIGVFGGFGVRTL